MVPEILPVLFLAFKVYCELIQLLLYLLYLLFGTHTFRPVVLILKQSLE